MRDFAARIGSSVQAARESLKQERESQRREEEETARQLKHGRERASEMIGTIWERVRTAADASDGALDVHRSNKGGVTIFELRWQEGEPSRSLRITVDETDGMIQAAWTVAPGYGRPVDAPTVAASGFEIAKIETVILLLVDQTRWAHRAVPSIPW
jgi:hypothetical protein